jgi:cytoskeletal protein RodZ
MATLGRHLKEARLGKGIGLAAIADETKINVRYLQAVEDEDLGVLPGGLFARNFARQYAACLGIEGQEVEDQIRQAFPLAESAAFPIAAEPAGPIRVEPLSEPRAWQAANLKRIALSLTALAAVAGAGSAVYRLWQEIPEIVEVSRQKAERTRQELNRPPQVSQDAASPPPSPVVPAASTVSESRSGEETTVTISGSGMAVQLVASGKAWVSVTANGKRIFRGTLGPNERKTVSGVENAKIVVGNAGALQVLTDGRDIGPIGGDGQVRLIILSPEGPQILPQIPSPSSERRTST